MRRRTALVAAAASAGLLAAMGLIAVGPWSGDRDRSRANPVGSVGGSRATPTTSSAAPGPATPRAPVASDASDPFARLLYLHYNDRRQMAVLNHDSETPRRTYFASVGQSLLGATVRSVAADQVVLDHPERGEIVIPYLGIAEAAPAIERPYDARRDQLPVVYSDGYDFAEEARVNAEIARRMASAGHGGGKGDGSGGGKGRGRKRGKRSHASGPSDR